MMLKIVDRIVLNTYRIVFGAEPSIGVNNFVKNLTFVAVGFGTSAILGLATQVFAGRILGPIEYGKYALILAISSFLSLPMILGVTTALTKYSAEKDNFIDRKKIISTSYLLFTFSSVFSLIILLSFFKFLSNLIGVTGDFFIYAVIFSFILSCYGISISIAQGLKEMKILAALQVIYGISGIATFFIFVSLNIFTFKAILFASSANYFLIFILASIIFRKYISLDFDRAIAKKILKYGLYALVGLVAYIIYSNFDRIVINKFLGNAQVGIYGSYYIAFIASAGFVFNIFNFVFFPMASGTKDKELLFKKINSLVPKISVFVLFFMMFLGIIIVKSYGAKFQFDLLSCVLFDIAAVLSVLNGIYVWCMNAVGEKGIRITSIAAVAAAIANVIINIILVPLIGSSGSIMAVMASFIISIIIVNYRKEYYKLEKLATD